MSKIVLIENAFRIRYYGRRKLEMRLKGGDIQWAGEGVGFQTVAVVRPGIHTGGLVAPGLEEVDYRL